MKRMLTFLLVSSMLLSLAACNTNDKTAETPEKTAYSYTIVDTGQTLCYDKDGNEVDPSEGEALYGQDAQYGNAEPSYTDNGDDTVTDNNTGLMWQIIPSSENMSWDEAVEYCEDLELAGYDDWRIPTAKELFSLSDFEPGWPYLDTDYFEFPEADDRMPPMNSEQGGPQGGEPQSSGSSDDSDSSETLTPPAQLGNQSDTAAGTAGAPETTDENSVGKAQGQFWSSNYYELSTANNGAPTAFGVNHATGHIKAYPCDADEMMGKYVRAVRGEIYGENDFTDNGDGTVTDNATGLMWAQVDAEYAMEWEDALVYAENSELAGYSDWKLPNVKELQSIVDYSGSYPAIDQDYFTCTKLDENENYYFWTSTSAYFSTADPTNYYAWYVAFGYAVGEDGEDVHGAGAVRFSQKYTESLAEGEGGDNITNSVRVCRSVIYDE